MHLPVFSIEKDESMMDCKQTRQNEAGCQNSLIASKITILYLRILIQNKQNNKSASLVLKYLNKIPKGRNFTSFSLNYKKHSILEENQSNSELQAV